MSVRVSFREIERMLQACAPGYKLRLATHSYVVSFNNSVYPSLPKYDNIEINHIRKLIRTLGISKECAEQIIGALRKH